MEKWHIFGLLLAGLVVAAGAASAFMDFADTATRDKIQQALKDNDYQAWKDAVTAGLTQERFNQAVQSYNQHQDRLTQMDAAAAAIESDDYDAYVKALTEMGMPVDRIPTKDEFANQVTLHNEHPGMGLFMGKGMRGGMHRFD
jgi:Na+-translocating ferredoxin:NAD+ oxidoreductase RnfG subunit